MFGKKSLILLLSFYVVAFGQSERVISTVKADGFVLSVKAPRLKTSPEQHSGNTILDYPDYTNPELAGEFKMPYDELIIAIPAGSEPKVTISDVQKKVYANTILKLNPTITRGEDSTLVTKDLPVTQAKKTANIPAIEVKGTFWFRDFYCVHVKVNLAKYQYSNNSVEEVTGYKLNVSCGKSIASQASPIAIHSDMDKSLRSVIANANMAEQFRAKPSTIKDDTTGAWINYGASYVKIGVANDGVFRLTKTGLETIGVSASAIDFSTIQLFDRGVEVPVYVPAANDYVEFYGHKNYNPISCRIINPDSLPYNEYMNHYTDTTYYFLTWGAKAGLRTGAVDGTPLALVTDTLNYYHELNHYEKDSIYQEVSVDDLQNQDPTRQESKSTFDNYLYFNWGSYADLKYNFNTTDLIAGKKAIVYARLLSSGSSAAKNSHTVSFGLKTNLAVAADTNIYYLNKLSSFDRNQRFILGGKFPSDSLKAGKNTLVVRNYDNGTFPNHMLFDWYEVEYPRTIKATNDTLYFEIRDSSVAVQKRNVKIANVTSAVANLLLYRVKPSVARITNFVKSGSDVVFVDSMGIGYAYYLCASANVKTPDFLQKKQFANLRSSSRKADYIGITHPSLYTAASSYVSFIRQTYKNADNTPVDTALVLVGDIFDEFAYGYPDPASIRSFLQCASAYWQAPMPSSLCLIGSACYDYKRNYYRMKHTEVNTNLVPSYGEPVSDAWYTMWNTTDAPLVQQMLFGRLPSRTPAELSHYLSKHQNYVNQRADVWNKRAIFFSGGNGNDSLQLSQLKLVNDIISEQYAQPAPLALSYDHFYKTYSPSTDFGPFEALYVRRSIEKGGLFISYIGHSGTRTWDNSIDNPDQLLNTSTAIGKSPMVTDFGCSTNKFAEPDVESFGGLFVDSGQTIAYIGNTSLGFSPTSTTIPILFYAKILADTVTKISQAHFDAKMQMFSIFGKSGWYRVFAMTNTLLGDPLVKIALPTKPNMTLSSSDIALLNESPNDQMDTLGVKIHYYNYGTVINDSCTVKIVHSYTHLNRDTVITSLQRVKIPGYSDSLTVYVPVKNAPGTHTLTVQLDPNAVLDELYKDDNTQTTTFYVASLSLKPLSFSDYSAAINPSVKILNTTSAVTSIKPEIVVQYDTVATFSSSAKTTFNTAWDTVFTKISFPGIANRRYWTRYSIYASDTLWSNIAPIYKTDKDASFLLQDKVSFSHMDNAHMIFDNGFKIGKDSIFIRVESAGGDYSKYGSIKKNDINVLDNTFGWGVGLAVFNSATLALDTAKAFNYGDDSTEVSGLLSMISKIVAGKIVCMCVINDATTGNNLTSAQLTTIKNTIKNTFGDTLFAKIGYREPWVMIAQKGLAKPLYAKKEAASYAAILEYDTVFVVNNETGSFQTPMLSKTGKLQDFQITATVPSGSTLHVRPVVANTSGKVDTLTALTLANPSANTYTADISSISTTTYPQVGLLTDMSLAADGTSPVISSFALRYTGLPELGINYQGVVLPSDTVYIGKSTTLNIIAANAGDVAADSVRITVRELPADSVLDSRVITSFGAESKVKYTLNYEPALGAADRKFVVSIDPENKITEYYKDNNAFTLPFYVAVDTVLKPSLAVKFDGSSVFENDFVSSSPEIKVELTDPSLEQVDTTYARVSFKMYLDGNLIEYANPNLSFTYSNANPKLTAHYKPTLLSGDHVLKIQALGLNLKDTALSTTNFVVNDDFVVTSVYNYPNPAKNITNFTFHISRMPDDLSIRIYTVAGRLIRTIKPTISDLKIGFNKNIVWDCRDEDGDIIANGVYLYKIKLVKDGKSVTSIHKLAIIK
jgi:hypothetical protein